MRFYLFCQVVKLGVCLALLGLSGFAQTTQRPNVILILTDDQGYGDLGCHGNPLLKTPNLDRLHAESVRLTDFHASPLCAPTRAALLTGRYHNRTGVWHVLGGHSLLRRDETTLGEIFRVNGYATALFGKWHLGESYPYRPQDRGFDQTLIHGGGGIGTIADFWGNDYFDDTYWRNGKAEQVTGYSTDVLFDEAMKFIAAQKAQPFYVQLSTAAPHDPHNVSERYSAPYLQQGLNDEIARFYGMIANLDENVGRLNAQLDALNLRDNTILIFMTDNGSVMGARAFNAGMRGNKGTIYDGGHRVPFFIRWPRGKLQGGLDVTELTAHIDVAPTLVSLCKLKLPRPIKFDGVNLAERLRGAASVAQSDRIVIVDNQSIAQPVKWRNSAVMSAHWRLVRGNELYDIRHDPAQKNNLAAAQPATVQRLRAAYEKWWAELAPTFSDIPHLVIGAPEENPVWLTTWDLHGQPVYDQFQVEAAERADGYWAIEVARAGEYEITLRRWPPEISRPLNEKLAVTRLQKRGSKPVTIEGAHLARLQIGPYDETQTIDDGAYEVIFRVPLAAGKTRLQAWFINNRTLQGATFGVYYVGARWLAPAKEKP
jgi:arylsulfatase B